MNNIHALFNAIESGENVSSKRATEIDESLSRIHGHEIPEKYASSMMDYINFRLLHNSAEEPVRTKLQSIYEFLSERSRNA